MNTDKKERHIMNIRSVINDGYKKSTNNKPNLYNQLVRELDTGRIRDKLVQIEQDNLFLKLKATACECRDRRD